MPPAFWKAKVQGKAERTVSDLRLTLTSAYLIRCGLAWDKARPGVKRMSRQTQGGWVK